MADYTLKLVDGSTIEFAADNDTEAETAALARFGHEAVAADQWDADGFNDDDEPVRRLLIWASDDEANDDDGSHSIASLTTTGHA